MNKKISDFAAFPISWKSGETIDDVAVRTSACLSRNFHNKRFPLKAGAKTLATVLEQARRAVKDSPTLTPSQFFLIDSLSKEERQCLLERQLITPSLLKKTRQRGVISALDEAWSLMINEEDHLNFRAYSPGFDLYKPYEFITRAGREIQEVANLEFHRNYGFLTSNPMIAGSGLRLSVILHLPALMMTDRLGMVARAVTELGLGISNSFHDGKQPIAHYIEIQNESSLEEEKQSGLKRFERNINMIIEAERNARRMLVNKQRDTLYDLLGRAYGVLRYAHRLGAGEALDCLSTLRLGAQMGIFPQLDSVQIQRLSLELQTGHFELLHKDHAPKDSDLHRATLVRASLELNKS